MWLPIKRTIIRMSGRGVGKGAGDKQMTKYLGIGNPEPEDDIKATKEKYLKCIKEISKNLGKVKDSDFEITEERKREIQRLEARDGKIVVAIGGTSREDEGDGDIPKSVIEMRRKLKGNVTGYGTLVGVTEQYVVVSRTVAMCSGNVRCACDASPDEHTRPCGYSVDIKHDPPVPVIISVFDTGNGKALVCPRCKGMRLHGDNGSQNCKADQVRRLR